MPDILQWAVYRATLDPVVGSEQRGTRPVLVVSHEAFHRLTGPSPNRFLTTPAIVQPHAPSTPANRSSSGTCIGAALCARM